ncbi:retrovirus-related pol polyprotein from transposon TNT 1-94 [Tanacetum coccineum]
MVELPFSKFKEDKDRMLSVRDHKGMLQVHGGNTLSQAKLIKCYNCQGEGRMARQCTQPKRRRDATWFKEKVLLVQVQAEGKELDEEQLAFLADPGVADDEVELQYSEQTPIVDYPDNEITSDINIIPYSQYLEETQQAIVQNTNTFAQ